MIDEFIILKTLGSGTFATAYLSTHIKTKEISVLKVISDETLYWEDLVKWARKEFSIQKSLRHPSIVQLKNSYEI